jgi:hypothetical protein
MRMMKSGSNPNIPDGFYVANCSYQRICIKCLTNLTSTEEGRGAYLKTGGREADLDFANLGAASAGQT